jgi:hypothetical protein
LVLELRHKNVKCRVTDPDEVAHIDAEISQWWNEVQDFVDPAFMSEDDSPPSEVNMAIPPLKPFHRLLLVVQKHEALILLNRPVITSGSSFAVAAAMQKCIGASKAIILSIFQHMQDSVRNEGSRDGRFWPGFTWCVWMRYGSFTPAGLVANHMDKSGLILLYAASDGCYSVQMAQRYAFQYPVATY